MLSLSHYKAQSLCSLSKDSVGAQTWLWIADWKKTSESEEDAGRAAVQDWAESLERVCQQHSDQVSDQPCAQMTRVSPFRVEVTVSVLAFPVRFCLSSSPMQFHGPPLQVPVPKLPWQYNCHGAKSMCSHCQILIRYRSNLMTLTEKVKQPFTPFQNI